MAKTKAKKKKKGNLALFLIDAWMMIAAALLALVLPFIGLQFGGFLITVLLFAYLLIMVAYVHAKRKKRKHYPIAAIVAIFASGFSLIQLFEITTYWGKVHLLMAILGITYVTFSKSIRREFKD